MKIKHKAALTAIFILGAILFAACDEDNGATQGYGGETAALAGFIEISDNTLYITPVEVFLLYQPHDEFGFDLDPHQWAITFVQVDNAQMLEEYGLTLDDFPSGIHIRPNWHNERHWFYVEQANIETLSFEITGETEFVFINSDRQHITTNVPGDFLPYLYPTVVHFIEVRDGRVIRLVQEFGFTI